MGIVAVVISLNFFEMFNAVRPFHFSNIYWPKCGVYNFVLASGGSTNTLCSNTQVSEQRVFVPQLPSTLEIHRFALNDLQTKFAKRPSPNSLGFGIAQKGPGFYFARSACIRVEVSKRLRNKKMGPFQRSPIRTLGLWCT